MIGPVHGARPAERVLIVGGGLTGAAAAIALARSTRRPLAVTIADPDPMTGKGLAYGKAHHGELLNVRAGEVSLLPDLPSDFADWLAERGASTDDGPLDQSFAERADFGDYVTARFGEIVPHALDLTRIHAAVSSLEPLPLGGYRAALSDGSMAEADTVMLATGYGIPTDHGRLGRAPFARQADKGWQAARRIALVGAGLTMVDVLFRLRDAGYGGEIVILSGRMVFPRAHAPRRVQPAGFDADNAPRQIAALLKEVRRQIEAHSAAPDGWQAVMNGIRPVAPELWQNLPPASRRAFMRHLKPYYFAHRHRLPPQAARRLAAELADPRTLCRKGRVEAVEEASLTLRRSKNAPAETLDADIVIDCSGHAAPARTSLAESLLRSGLAAPPATGPGFEVTGNGRLVDAEGRTLPDLYALGPPGQGALLEITGIREIVAQCYAAASNLAGRC